jgi:hypothetical protein
MSEKVLHLKCDACNWSVRQAIATDDDEALRLGQMVSVRRVHQALAHGAPGKIHDLTVTTILSQRTRQGMVELTLNGEHTQMDLDKAREVLRMLSGAIEAAVSDTLLFAFLTERIGLSVEQAGAALGDFRELRQGSRGIVHPH